jgi:hypothetical protein
MLKKARTFVMVTIPMAAVAANAALPTGLNQGAVDTIVTDLTDWGSYVILGIGGVLVVAAGLRLLVKGINRAVGK